MRERLAVGAAVLLAAIFVGSLGWSGYTIVQEDARLENALFALCAFQDDLERRLLAGQQFIEEHPKGIPGISRSDLERSIASQQQTLSSIAPYLTDCPEEEDAL